MKNFGNTNNTGNQNLGEKLGSSKGMFSTNK